MYVFNQIFVILLGIAYGILVFPSTFLPLPRTQPEPMSSETERERDSRKCSATQRSDSWMSETDEAAKRPSQYG